MKNLFLESEVFSRAIEEIITKDELKERLAGGKQLRIKFGADITASTLHLGHAVNLWKMRELQEYGHKVVFVVGDFTTQIGDPTGRIDTRKKMFAKDIGGWAKNFIDQIEKILLTDKKVFEVRRNSEWYAKMKTDELFKIFSFFTHTRLIERAMFQERIKRKTQILIPELLYPILQGYDSVVVKSDLTIVGSDQLFNENIGRFLQEKFKQRPQVLVTTLITPGIDGHEKMSKSLGNFIGLNDSPQDKFGKTMRLPDNLIISYFEAHTDVPIKEIDNIKKSLGIGKNPMEAKLLLAEAIVKRYHGEAVAKEEHKKFMGVFSGRHSPQEIPDIKLSSNILDPITLLVETKLVSSRSEARRLIRQGAVEIGDRAISLLQQKINISGGEIIKVGKRKFARLGF